MRITWDVVVWRRWKTRSVAWCRREWRRMVAGVLVAAMLGVPGAAVVRKEVAVEGEVFGPIHFWQGDT